MKTENDEPLDKSTITGSLGISEDFTRLISPLLEKGIMIPLISDALLLIGETIKTQEFESGVPLSLYEKKLLFAAFSYGRLNATINQMAGKILPSILPSLLPEDPTT